MIIRRVFLLLLMFAALSFAGRYISYRQVPFDSVADKFSQKQTVAEKLETAPVAYYGSLIQREYLHKEFDGMNHLVFAKKFPEVYKSFIGWSDYKQTRQNELLSQAPEKYRHMFEERYSSMAVKGFFLIHDEIRVDKVYDKATKTWVTPKPEDAKKELFSFAYVGPDIAQDSSWMISQRMMSHLNEPDDKSKLVKRIFFMDGYSQECYTLMDTSVLERLTYYPHRLKYDVKPTAAMTIREKMQVLIKNGDYKAAGLLADSANLSPRSKIIAKILNRDYAFMVNGDSTGRYLDGYNGFVYADSLDEALDEAIINEYSQGEYCRSVRKEPDVDGTAVCGVLRKVAQREFPEPVVVREGGFRFNAFFDFGHPFLIGKFPDFDPMLYLDLGFNIYAGDWFGGIGVSIRTLDAKCDSCGTGDFGAHFELGYLWLKTKYVESGVWGNLGFSAVEVPPIKGKPDSEYQHERYFRYGFGIYFDALFPSLIGKPVKSFWEKGLGNRFGARLKLGMQNMNISEIGHGKGLSPFVSLGFTWHLVKLAY